MIQADHKRPLVSVIIPTYNHAHFLGRALQSVMDQTYSNWEAFVIDNHSIDRTDDLVRKFPDPRIHLLKIHNGGVIAASRNLGLAQANGDWVAFLDSDDCWYVRKLETIIALIENGDDSDVFCHDEYVVQARGGRKNIIRYGPATNDFYRVLLIEGNRLSTSATVVRRQFIEQNQLRFDEWPDFVTVEDYGLWLELARAGARFSFLRDVLGEYVIHDTNNSNRLARHWANTDTLLRHHVFTLQQFHPSPDLLWRTVSTRLSLARVRQALGERHWQTALVQFARIFRASPVSVLSYLRRRMARHR